MKEHKKTIGESLGSLEQQTKRDKYNQIVREWNSISNIQLEEVGQEERIDDFFVENLEHNLKIMKERLKH